jgi:hypothetical protein
MGLAGSICNRLDIFIIVLVQIDEASPQSSPLNRGAGGERTIHSLMRKQSARGRLMTLRGQKSPSRQMGVSPTPGWGLRRRESRNSNNQILSLTGADKELRVRVIIHPHHPWNKEVTAVGKVIVLPKTIEELLKVASK